MLDVSPLLNESRGTFAFVVICLVLEKVVAHNAIELCLSKWSIK